MFASKLPKFPAYAMKIVQYDSSPSLSNEHYIDFNKTNYLLEAKNL